ncbi:hypothetical protein BD289DRAFT_339532, partial [Coniella lustricola]
STARRCKTLVILDSSFNPPTVAHMQMATSALRDLQTQRGIAAKLKGGLDSTTAASDIRLLLLLAVNNADKEAKPASFEERLLMMQAFAGDIQRAWQDAQSQSQPQTQQQDKHDVPIDIGLTTWPYFNDKSDAIAASPDYDFSPAQATSDPAEQTPVTEQVVLAGYDTLIRIFNPKYYKPAASEQDATTTKRTTQTPMQAALDPFFARAHLRITMRTDADWGDREAQMAYVDGLLRGDELESIGGRKEWAKRVEVVEGLVSEDGLVLSSTEAREAVKTRDWKKLEQLVPQGVADLIE